LRRPTRPSSLFACDTAADHTFRFADDPGTAFPGDIYGQSNHGRA